MTGRNPWAVLGVAEDATDDEIRRAFRRRVKQTHPDRGGDAGECAAVLRAFDAVRPAVAPRPPSPAPAPFAAPPPSRRPGPARPTPYDRWVRPGRAGRCWTETGPAAAHLTGPTPSGRVSPAAAPGGASFASALRHELATLRRPAGS